MIISQCIFCSHLRTPSERPKKSVPLVCSAFPNGIPEPIEDNKFIHTKPYPGDHGIRYSPLPEFADSASDE